MQRETTEVAVFTGDLVGSSNLTNDQIETAISALAKSADKAAEWHGASLQFTRHRGDGWQVILAEPKYALRTALYFRASLKALGVDFDTYIGGSFGTVAPSDDTDLNNRNEAVFVQSGRVLEMIKSTESNYANMLIISSSGEEASTILADHIVKDWTPVQAEVMSHMLSPNEELSYTEVAKILEKSRQSVSKSLIAAGYLSISIALETLEDTDD